jgi:hypothetical protein
MKQLLRPWGQGKCYSDSGIMASGVMTVTEVENTEIREHHPDFTVEMLERKGELKEQKQEQRQKQRQLPLLALKQFYRSRRAPIPTLQRRKQTMT